MLTLIERSSGTGTRSKKGQSSPHVADRSDPEKGAGLGDDTAVPESKAAASNGANEANMVS